MKISIIIPVYNVGELLRKSVDSVINQIRSDCEIIIVDDGSTDNSGDICDEYSTRKEIKVIHKKNGGLSSARNTGIDTAQGEYLLFLDSDDYLRPGSIDILYGIIAQKGYADFIQFRYDEVSDYSDIKKAVIPSTVEELTNRQRMFEQKFILGGIGASACTKLISRKVFNTLRFKEGIIHEDEQFTIHLINRANRALYISSSLYMYVQRQDSIITSKFSRKRLDIIPVLEEQIKVLQSNGFSDLVQLVKNKLFSAICIIYVDARHSGDKECAKFLNHKAKTIVKDTTIGGGTIGLIAKGLKINLPMLQLYSFFKSLRNG